MKIEVAKSSKRAFIICTPIGNISEISKRTIDTLTKCDILYCEDTRNTTQLLRILNIKIPTLKKYDMFNERDGVKTLIDDVKKGNVVGIVSDAGYPTVSDPGEGLVRQLYENDIAVEIINGSTAVIHALIASSFIVQPFVFYGFMPRKNNDLKKFINSISNYEMTVVCFEAPHRILETLQFLLENFPHLKLAVARELTKLYETIYIGTASEILANITAKGEMVIIFDRVLKPAAENIPDSEIISKINFLVSQDKIKLKEACKVIAEELDDSASRLYEMYIKNNIVKP